MSSTAKEASKSQIIRTADEKVNWVSSIPFLIVHLLPLAAIWVGISTKAIVLAAILLIVRMFFITAGYHRYFAHKSFELNRFWAFVFAFGGTTAAQKGPLWWASLHRDHHRFSDTDFDIHSPRKGFWWSHVGWILCDKYNATQYSKIQDFSKFPELRFIERHNWIGPWSIAIFCVAVAGWSGLVIGFFTSTVMLWHGTFSVNSLAHVWGNHRASTEKGNRPDDTSRNNLVIALYTGGEGWHNNHHVYPHSARQGFFWWQVDTTYYTLVLLSWIGIVKNLKKPSSSILNYIRSS